MKKIVFALVALVVAVPAMASQVDVNAVQVGTTLEVEITYEATSGLPRAFALDITVDSGTITGISNYVTGESGPGNIGHGIFPANFNRYIDPCAPNWSDVNYTPVAEPCDLPGDTQDGIGTDGITIEMGSLYVGGPNSPLASDTLCNITVSGDCTVSLALNVGRAGIIMEDGNAPGSINLYGCTVVTTTTVPNVMDMNETEAIAAITGADLVVGATTYECNNVEAADEVLDQDPDGGEVVPIDSAVDLWVSTGLCLVSVPDIVGMTPANAYIAIDACGLTGGTQYNNENSSVTVDLVAEGDPLVGTMVLFGSTVDIYVSAGDCMDPCHPDYTMWVGAAYGWDRPDCWCNDRQQRGNADQIWQGPFPVGTFDLDIFRLALSKHFALFAGNPQLICADFNHTWQGPFPVGTYDLGIFRKYLSKHFSQTPVTSGPGCQPITILSVSDPCRPCDANALPNTEFNFWDDVGGD